MIGHQFDARQKCSVLATFVAAALLASCSSNPKQLRETARRRSPLIPGPVRVLVVDAPELGRVIERRWRANSEGEIEKRDVGAEFITDETTEENWTPML